MVKTVYDPTKDREAQKPKRFETKMQKTVKEALKKKKELEQQKAEKTEKVEELPEAPTKPDHIDNVLEKVKNGETKIPQKNEPKPEEKAKAEKKKPKVEPKEKNKFEKQDGRRGAILKALSEGSQKSVNQILESVAKETGEQGLYGRIIRTQLYALIKEGTVVESGTKGKKTYSLKK